MAEGGIDRGGNQGLRTTHERIFVALYRDNLQRLRAYIRRFLVSPADADEVAHDAFLRLYRSDLAGYADPEAVLFKTGWRLALNRLRARRSNPLDHADEIVPDHDLFVAQEETAEEALLSRERDLAYRAALAALPPRCRQVIELRTVQELSYKEMSARLGLSVSTIEKHAVKAKKVCTEALAAWHADGIQAAA
jgi:RNA polymerase sigma-70 factor (ECF subfamily)